MTIKHSLLICDDKYKNIRYSKRSVIHLFFKISCKKMARFKLKDSDEHYLYLSDQPKRFDADSPVTNVFFDDTNGQVSETTV